MANSLKPAIGTYAAVTAGSPVQPLVPIPDNCHTIIIYNPEADDAFIGWATNALDFQANILTAVRIIAGTATTLAIGPATARPTEPGDILFCDIGVGSGNLYITYVNGLSL